VIVSLVRQPDVCKMSAERGRFDDAAGRRSDDIQRLEASSSN
jgi:hypothetical protein